MSGRRIVLRKSNVEIVLLRNGDKKMALKHNSL